MVEEGPRDRLRLIGRDIAEQCEHRSQAWMPSRTRWLIEPSSSRRRDLGTARPAFPWVDAPPETAKHAAVPARSPDLRLGESGLGAVGSGGNPGPQSKSSFDVVATSRASRRRRDCRSGSRRTESPRGECSDSGPLRHGRSWRRDLVAANNMAAKCTGEGAACPRHASFRLHTGGRIITFQFFKRPMRGLQPVCASALSFPVHG